MMSIENKSEQTKLIISKLIILNDFNKKQSTESSGSINKDNYELQIIPKPKKRKLKSKTKKSKYSWFEWSDGEQIEILDVEEQQPESLSSEEPECNHYNKFVHQDTTETICKDCGTIIETERHDIEREFGEQNYKEFQTKNTYNRKYVEYINTFEGKLPNKINYSLTKTEAFKIIDELYKVQTKLEQDEIDFRRTKRTHKIKEKISEVRLDWNEIQKVYKKIGYEKSLTNLWRSFPYQILGYDLPIIKKLHLIEIRCIDIWIRDNYDKIKNILKTHSSNVKISKRGRPKKDKDLPKPPIKFKPAEPDKDKDKMYESLYLKTNEDEEPPILKISDTINFGSFLYDLMFKDEEHKEQLEYERKIEKIKEERLNNTNEDDVEEQESYFGDTTEKKIRLDYLLYKKCEMEKIKNYKNIPLKINQKTIDKYDKLWRIICDLQLMIFYPTTQQTFRIDPIKLKAKWINDITDSYATDTGNPRKIKLYDNNRNIKWVDYDAPKKEKIIIRNKIKLSDKHTIEEIKYFEKLSNEKYMNFSNSNVNNNDDKLFDKLCNMLD